MSADPTKSFGHNPDGIPFLRQKSSMARFLNIDKSGKRAIYIPSVTSKKFYENYAQEIVKDSYNGAIKDFIAAFTAGNKLSAAEKAELLSYIQTL